MSNTPKTDLVDLECHAPGAIVDRYAEMRDHAKNLERENSRLRDTVKEFVKAFNVAPWGWSSLVEKLEKSIP